MSPSPTAPDREADAFRRGAEAMREAAAAKLEACAMELVAIATTNELSLLEAVAEDTRALPLPEPASPWRPPQCPQCGAPTRDGLYYNEALVEETGKRIAAEYALQKALASLPTPPPATEGE